MNVRPEPGRERDPVAHSVDVLGEIAVERGRQVRLGFDAAHDDTHREGDLARAGMAHGYLAVMGFPFSSDYALGLRNQIWPWPALDTPPPEFTTVRDHLVKGAALFVAAIERIDRDQARRGAER